MTDQPVDPYSVGSLRYQLVDGQLLLYSVGPDRDDDAGRPLLDQNGGPVDPPPYLTLDELERVNESDPTSIDGDWILFPPAD